MNNSTRNIVIALVAFGALVLVCGVVVVLVTAASAGFVLFGASAGAQSAAPTVVTSTTTASPIPLPNIPTATSPKYFASAPPMLIDVKKKYTATFKMAKGSQFVIDLYADKAPLTVNNFVYLARLKYFDGVTFHRVLEGFMAQGGDPTGTGMGGPGYTFKNEDSDLKFDKAGVVAMANAGRNTNGSQFFITFGPTPQLNGGYTIFGQVTSGMDVVNKITRRDPETNPTFKGDTIESVTITEK